MRRQAWLATLMPFVILVPVALFIIFLFAYGFVHTITVRNHLVFLIGAALAATVIGLLAGIVVSVVVRGLSRGAVELPTATTLRFGLLASYAVIAAVIAAGTLISMANHAQGSVTAQQSPAPFIVLVVLLLAASVIAGRAANATLPNAAPIATSHQGAAS